MKVVAEYSVCPDCLMAIAYNDLPPDREQARMIDIGMHELGPYLHPGGEEYGFCKTPCDCCGSRLHGNRYQVIQLGEEG